MDSGFKKRKMRKALTGFIAAMCMSCSNDNEPEAFNRNIENGLYAYYGTEYIVTIGTDYKDGWNYETNCEPGYISILDAKTGTPVYNQINGISTVTTEYGDKDNTATVIGWGYNNGLSILCVPTSRTTFTGIVTKQSPDISLPGEMRFKKLK